ncbi:MAG: ATP-binding protein [Flavobacteriales bacterium]|jgi:two-component system, OmpR family, phosphate regulon sensor histidine kinase PhoR
MKFSSGIFFSFVLGLISFVISSLGMYLLLNDPDKEPEVLLVSFSIGGIVFVVSYFALQIYTKRKFKKIYRSIGIVYEKNGDIFGKDAQLEIENWLNKKTTEIQKLKSTEAYRREFFGNLAHELKTPVFSVEGYILTLLEGGLEDESINRKFLNKAAKGIDRITNVIADMDTITKIESGNLKLNLKRISLFELIKNILSELEDLAENHEIKVTLEKPSVAEIFVTADKLRLEQVVTNLVSNSIYYGKKGGESVISAKEIAKGKILVKVTDNGLGIAKEHLPRLFERFYRVEKSRDRNQGGSGIGLAIVKHIVEAHNQKISVESNLDKGTTFSFTLDKA